MTNNDFIKYLISDSLYKEPLANAILQYLMKHHPEAYYEIINNLKDFYVDDLNDDLNIPGV